MAVLTLTKDNFEKEVLNASGPVLVDFWATWCGPCKMFGPVVEEFQQDNEGKVTVGKLDVDQEPDIAAKYGVMSIPTTILFKGGQPVETLVGMQPKEKLEELL